VAVLAVAGGLYWHNSVIDESNARIAAAEESARLAAEREKAAREAEESALQAKTQAEREAETQRQAARDAEAKRKADEDARKAQAVREAEACVSRGNEYYRKNDYDRAIEEYTKSITLNPNDAVSYYNRGLAYKWGKNNYDRAIADFETALRIDPNDYLAKNNLTATRKARGW